MGAVKLSFIFSIAIALLSVFSIDASAVTFSVRSQDALQGTDQDLGIDVSSVMEKDNYVVVSITFRGVKEIRADIDYNTHTLSIKSISLRTGELVSLTKQEVVQLDMLGQSLDDVRFTVGDALVSIVSFLSEAPPGKIINIRTGEGTTRQPQPADIISLCDGGMVTGQYDVGRRTITKTVEVGPCYSESNACMGRCGTGCNRDLPPRIQRFTQDCLNHDLCGRGTGHRYGPCTNEWFAAADDFLWGTDCGSMTGSWSDDYSYIWTLDDTGIITGSVNVSSEVPQCPVWSVRGSHEGANISLTATNPPPIEDGCCSALTYTGTLSNCNAANGSWTNACGRSGMNGMSRRGTADSAIRESIQNALDARGAPRTSPASDR